MKTYNEVKEQAKSASQKRMSSMHKQMYDYVGHHIENTGMTHDEIKTKFMKKFGTQHASKFHHIVRKMVD